MTKQTVEQWKPATFTLTKGNDFGTVYYQEAPYPSAIAYKAKAKNRTWYYHFKSSDKMHTEIAAFLKDLTDRQAAVDQRRKERANYDATQDWKVGDIIYNSWGYDQTNIDFYKIIAVTKKYVTIQEIGCDSQSNGMMMSGTKTPKDSDGGEISRHAATKHSIKMRFGSGSRWDGTPKHYSWDH